MKLLYIFVQGLDGKYNILQIITEFSFFGDIVVLELKKGSTMLQKIFRLFKKTERNSSSEYLISNLSYHVGQ